MAAILSFIISSGSKNKEPRYISQYKYQQDAACNRMYYSKVYWKLNMFRAANRSSSGALNCICSLWFIYPCGDRPLSRLSGKLLQAASCWYFYWVTKFILVYYFWHENSKKTLEIMVNKPLTIKYWKSTDSAELRSASLCLECLVDFGLPQACSDPFSVQNGYAFLYEFPTGILCHNRRDTLTL